MKMLTPLYLALMHAFSDRAQEIVGKFGPENSARIMQEYSTLRLDGGRQSGKTTAVVQFVADWLHKGNDVVFIGKNSNVSIRFKSMVAKYFKSGLYVDYDANIWNRIVLTSQRVFLSKQGINAFRGRSLNKTLFIVDEPIKVDMTKYYEQYGEGAFYSCYRGGIPMWFVIGIQ